MATLVQFTSASSTAGANYTTSQIDTSGADLIVIAISGYQFTCDLTDNKSNGTYTKLTQKANGSSYSQLHYLYAPTVGANHTFTIAASGAHYSSAVVAAFSGALASPFDQEAGGSASGTTVQPGSVTPGTANQVIIQGLSFDATATASIDGSYSIVAQANYSGGNNMGVALAWIQQGSAAATNPTWTMSGSATLAAAAATFKFSAAGGGVTSHGLTLLGVGN